MTTDAGDFLGEIRLPDRLEEMSLEQYINFMTVSKKLYQENANPIQIMAEAISEFSGLELDVVFEAALGPEYVDSEEVDKGLRQMYAWISKVINNFKPDLRTGEDFTFTHRGEAFEIPFVRHVALVSGGVMPDVTVQQAVEALEIIRLSERDAKEQGDPDGNHWYGQYLRLLAVLTKKPGEKMPAREAEREAFINERAAFFQGIDARTALDADFFLSITLMYLNKSHKIAGSLTRLALGQGVVMYSWNGRHTTAP